MTTKIDTAAANATATAAFSKVMEGIASDLTKVSTAVMNGTEANTQDLVNHLTKKSGLARTLIQSTVTAWFAVHPEVECRQGAGGGIVLRNKAKKTKTGETKKAQNKREPQPLSGALLASLQGAVAEAAEEDEAEELASVAFSSEEGRPEDLEVAVDDDADEAEVVEA